MNVQFFNEPGQTPQPPDKIFIEDLKVTPYPDRFRILIELQVTVFQERPNLLLVTRTTNNEPVSELNIIATMHTTMEFTMHLRGIDDPTGEYTLDAELFYETRNPPQDKKSIRFKIPPIDG